MDDHARDEADAVRRRVGTRVRGRYRLEDVIGVGGVGVVYRALDEETGDIVVVKTVRDELLHAPTVGPRFVREARIAMSLDHPAIPRGLDVATLEDGAPALVMELVTGRSFADLVAEGPLEVTAALRVGARVAEALAVAHAAGIVHRDVKPDNLMLLDGSEIPQGVCVLDFGIAFCVDEPRFTDFNMVVGTPAYLSPEQARGEAVTPSSDLYSLGATLVVLLTGATLFDGGTLVQIASHQMAPLPDWSARRPGIPPRVVEAVNGLLAKDPARRPESAAYVAERLAALARRGGLPDHDDDVVLAASSEPDFAELEGRLRELQRRHHQLLHDAAEAQRRIVQQIVELSARGGGAADGARIAALEAALERLLQHSLESQRESLADIRETRRRMRDVALG